MTIIMDTNSIISGIGIGGLLSVFLQAIFNHLSKVGEKNLELKETRYKAILILMWTYINPKEEMSHLRQYRSDIKNEYALRRELILELYEMLLYASDAVVKIYKSFIAEPNYENYSKVIIEMRKDLYGKSTKIKFQDIEPDKITIRISKS